jgi:hypothetical protein
MSICTVTVNSESPILSTKTPALDDLLKAVHPHFFFTSEKSFLHGANELCLA